MPRKKIKIANMILPYQARINFETKSGEKYIVIILKNSYLGDILIRKEKSSDKKYYYIVGFGALKIQRSMLKMINKTKSRKGYFENKLNIQNNEFNLKTLVGTHIYYTSCMDYDELNKSRELKNTFLNSSKKNLLDSNTVEKIGKTTKIIGYKVIESQQKEV